jgi:hypothetical protein
MSYMSLVRYVTVTPKSFGLVGIGKTLGKVWRILYRARFKDCILEVGAALILPKKNS